MKKLYALTLLIFLSLSSFSATYYWVGGDGSWGTAATASFATSSGGVGSALTPLSTDNVIFDANSGHPTVTLTAQSTIANLTVSGGGTITFDGAYNFYTTTSFTFSGGTLFSFANSNQFSLGTGGAFTLTGNDSNNYFTGVTTFYTGWISLNTTTPTNLYVDPAFTFFNFGVQKGDLTLLSNLNTVRLGLSSLNSETLIIGANKTLTLTFGGTSAFATTANAATGGKVDASASGCTMEITGSHDFTGENFFKANSTINNLKYNKSAGVLKLGQAITVQNLTLTNGNIDNSVNNITVASGGSITRSAAAGILLAPPVFAGPVNVTIAATANAGNELMGTSGRVGTLTVNDAATYTLNGSGIAGVSITSAGFGYGYAPTVTFNTPTNGTAATATANVSGGVITSISMTSLGIGYSASNPPTVTIAAPPASTAWAPSTAFAYHDMVTNNGNLYLCSVAGTTAGSGGPTTTTNGQVDGGAAWNYIAPVGATSTATATATYNSVSSLTVDALTIGTGTSGVLTYPNNNNALTLTVNNNITVNTGATLTSGTQTNAVTHLLNVGGNISNSATLNLTGSGLTNAVNLTLNGSSANQNLGGSGTISLNSLTINNTAGANPGATLTGAVSVANVLTFTNGKVTLGAYGLTINSTGSISGASASNYIVTDGVGKLTQYVTSSTSKSFPIGVSTSSYDPMSMTPSSSQNYSASVASTLSGSPINSGLANSREWDVTRSSSSPTVHFTFTPSVATNTTNPSIGNYNGSAWTEASASLSGSSYSTTATFTMGATNKYATGTYTAFYTSPKYWVGGSAGDWGNTSSWSTTSGGASGAAVPSSTDDVYFDNSGSNANPTVTSSANVTMKSLIITNSNVTFAPFNQTTTSNGVVSGSTTVTLSAANSKILVGQPVILNGTNGGTLAANTTVAGISGTTLTLSVAATGSSSSAGTLTFGTPYTITTTHLRVDGSQVTFGEQIYVYAHLVFQGTTPTITMNSYTNGRAFCMGNGNAFTLTGNSVSNYFTGNSYAYYRFNTTSSGAALSVYFNPTTITLGSIDVNKGDITLANNVNTSRFGLSNTSATNPPQLILGTGVTLGVINPGTSLFTNLADGGVIDASAAGSKFLLSGNHASIASTSGRIFKANSTINEFEYNNTTASPNNTFTPSFPMSLNKLTLTAGSIINTTNNITFIDGATITRKISTATLSAAPVFGTGTNVIYTNTAGITTGYELPASAATLSLNGTHLVTLNSAVSVSTTLAFTSCQLALGAYDLTLGASGSITGATSSYYVVTDGIGKFTQTVSSGVDKLFPVGISTTSYDPATINANATVAFSIKAGASLSGTPNNAAIANPRQWDVAAASGTPATTVTLTPSVATNTSSPVIGAYSGGVWNQAIATYNAGSFSKTYAAFSAAALATGTNLAFRLPYTIATSATNGSITGDAPGSYDGGTNLSFTATAGGGYHFVNWTVGGTCVSNANPYNFEVGADQTVVANFTLPAVSVSATTLTSTIADCAACDVTVTGTGTLNVDQARTLHDVTLDTGGKLLVSSPLTINNLVFKADKTTSFSANLSNSLTIAGTVKFLKTMDDTKWYFMSFPCDILISDIKLSDGSAVGTLNTNWFIKYYDGAQRVQNLGSATNWKNASPTGTGSETLTAFKGYIFGLKDPGTVEIMFPIVKDSVKNEPARVIPVTAYGDGVLTNDLGNAVADTHKGWNLVGQPYFSKYNGTGTNLTYLNIFEGSAYTTYYKTDASTIFPFSAYFVQADAALAASKITFALNSRLSASSSVSNNLTDMVQINVTTPTGTDKTNLIIDENESPVYQINHDMEKWLTTGTATPQIYSLLDGVKYAYNALPVESVQDLPLSLYTKTAGTTTIAAVTDAPVNFTQLLLTDNQTSTVTDLMTNNYSFDASAGTNSTRFKISAVRVATAATILPSNSSTEAPVLTTLDGSLLISNLRANSKIRVYDLMGRMVVSKISSVSTLEIPLSRNGVYTVQMESSKGSWTKKAVVGKI